MPPFATHVGAASAARAARAGGPRRLHEIPVRYALNAAAGSDELDGPEHAIPNATPYLFDDAALERAAARIEEITRSR